MVHHHGLRRRHGILVGILAGVMLLALCVSGVAVAAPSMNVTISLTTTPQPPTDFEITQTGVGSINITWTKGTGANITIVRGSTTGYPYSIFDGNAIYSGNGTWVEVGSLDLTTYTYYYRAWSQNNYGTSTGYGQDSIGASSGSGVDMSALIDYLSDFLEGPMGINSIVFILGLVGFAIWKKGWIRIILSLCVITWGIFALEYDIKIAAPLMGVGVVLFFMGILRMIQQRRAEAAESEG